MQFCITVHVAAMHAHIWKQSDSKKNHEKKQKL